MEIVSSLWGMIWDGETADNILCSITACNVKWGGTRCKIPLAICGLCSIVSLLFISVHVNQCFPEKIFQKFINQTKNTSHAPELLMHFGHFLTLFSVSSFSIVFTVLLDDCWINASFPVGVQLASCSVKYWVRFALRESCQDVILATHLRVVLR